MKGGTVGPVQLIELAAVYILALKEAMKQGLSQNHIFTDSWAIANGPVVCSGQWLRVNLLI